MSAPNTVALTYNGYVSQIATLTVMQTQTVSGVVSGLEPDFNSVIPQAINYAELRIQRDLDLAQSVVENDTYFLSIGAPTVTIDVNDYITLQTMSVVSGTATTPILPTSKEYLQNVYPDTSATGTPQFFAPYTGDALTTGATSQIWLLGPVPDQAYPLVLTGTVRMISLNSFANTAQAGTKMTFISMYLPDLLIMASMIYIAGFQRNFGRQSDDPAMAVSYESQYTGLLKGATVEEARRKFQASGWTSMSPPPVATVKR
jgi:hypothetical protein